MPIFRSFLLVASLAVSSAFVAPMNQIPSQQRQRSRQSAVLKPPASALKMFPNELIDLANTKVELTLWNVMSYTLAHFALSMRLIEHCANNSKFMYEHLGELQEERYRDFLYQNGINVKSHTAVNSVFDSVNILLTLNNLETMSIGYKQELDPANAINMPIPIVSQDWDDTIVKMEIRGTPTVIMVIHEDDGLGQLW